MIEKDKSSNVYLSIISNNDYLPGILTLNKSLIAVNSKYKFVVLVTENISQLVVEEMCSNYIEVVFVKSIFPKNVRSTKKIRWKYTYSKLNIFSQTQYSKFVFLDADALVLKNIDCLFDKQHLSAVPTGGLFGIESDRSPWVLDGLNSGVMVIEPSKVDFNDLISRFYNYAEARKDIAGDQEFLQYYYCDWPNNTALHLPAYFNVLEKFFPEYEKVFGYSEDSIYVLHYAGNCKPWDNDADSRITKKFLRYWQSLSYRE